ncbi:MAG: GIY-YIG nuclease family protein [Clostridiales bacterium]|mgnify:CR=1 FL=1|nr:GIY-YIG nuclease family protein [Clostridiales bacterium]
MLYYSQRIEIKDSDKIKYLGNYVRKEIEKQSDNEKARVLFDYPVVYVHTWENEGTKNFYVGETTDIVRRTDEHKKSGEKDKRWQEKWINGENRVSYFFGSRQMNKSLCLDLEDTLIEYITDVYKKNTSFNIHNKRANRQETYNNSCCKGELLNKIWGDLNNEIPLGALNYIEKRIELPECEDKLIPFSIKVDKNTTVETIEKEIKKNHPNDWKYLLEHPVVYMHCWLGQDDKFCVYTGEANSLLHRTEQHQNTEKNDLYYIDGKIDEKEDWHNSWKESSKRLMLVFGHPQFNKSMTLDIENRLIQYNIFHKFEKTEEQMNKEIITIVIEYMMSSAKL